MTYVRIAQIAGGVILIVAIVLWLRSCGAAPAQRAAAQARIGEAVAEGTAGAAQRATEITGNTMDQAAAIDRQTEANNVTIRSATGASAPVDPGAASAGLRALCMRRAYHDQPGCVALLKAGTAPAK